MNMKYKGIITFDLDGTLISTKSSAKRAYINAFKKTFNIYEINEPNFKGGVDLEILSNLCKRYGIELNSKNKKTFIDNYLKILENESDFESWYVYENAHDFLVFLKNLGFLLVIVSGNYYETGIFKLKKTYLDKYFEFLSFNNNERTRIELMQKAMEFAKNNELKILAHFGDAYSDIISSIHFNITPFLFLPEIDEQLLFDLKKMLEVKLLVSDISMLESQINSFYFINSSSINEMGLKIDKSFLESSIRNNKNLFIFKSYKEIKDNFENTFNFNYINSGGN